MASRARGFFITLEGPDGSGKSTQLRGLARRLRAQGWRVLTTREPGGVPLAESIRGLLLTPGPEAPVAAAELLLFLAARAQHVATCIRPALARGEVVLCERFSDSTFAYQVGGRQLPARWVRQADAIACQGLHPDLTLLLDVSPRAGLQRAFRAKQGHDRMERESRAFAQRVRLAFLALAQREPRRIRMIDAAQPLTQVAEAIWEAVALRLPRAARNQRHAL